MSTVVWTCVLMLAALWPSHTLSIVHGAPLDGRTAAVLAGLAFPVLAWLHPGLLASRTVRIAAVALLALKIADGALLSQQGLCAKFFTSAPYRTTILTMPIDEPEGALRSWDVRADWRAEAPRCTAIVDRAYDSKASFPAWFTNITDFEQTPPPPVTLELSGYTRADERGLFVLDVGRDMTVHGRIGALEVSSRDGHPMLAPLDAGTHRIELHVDFSGDEWRLVPTFNGHDAFTSTALTTRDPRSTDRVSALFSVLETSIVFLIAGAWIGCLAFEYRSSPALLAWCVAASVALAAIGVTGRFERPSVLLLAAAVLVPVGAAHRNLRGAMLLVGVPWLALIAARALPQIAHVTTYSNDDWLAYQAAGYRIFMHGFWLEGGSKAFDYQPLYRWITGALHLVFGDSSVGETFWDGICLWLGAAVAFVIVDRAAGFKWAVAAAAATLATFWVGTIWYFVGRGLSEVSAAGFGFFAALILLRDRAGALAPAALAGVFAVLMFYTRLNHLLFAVFLLALLPHFEIRAIGAYLATFAAGVALFAARTWWYTGVFSILYGTSLKNNDTGLRLTTLASPEVWAKVWHSLRALVWMNEPPSPDPRAALVVIGVLLSAGTLLQIPKLNRLPLPIAIVTLGACVSALLAHTHNYPGRMSIHLAPFAVAMTATAGARLMGR